MPSEYRSHSFQVKGSGSYVMLFQRPNQKALIECCFFGENMTVPETAERWKAMSQAVMMGTEWDDEWAAEQQATQAGGNHA